MVHFPRTLLLTLAALTAPVAGTAVARAAATAPTLAKAPGRVIFSVDRGAVNSDVDGGGAAAAVALPDGGAVLVGNGAPAVQPGALIPQSPAFAAQLQADGSLNTAFGGGTGIASLPPLRVDQIVRQPDGGLVVAGSGPAVNKLQFPQLVLVRLFPDGRLDPTFGTGGIDRLPIQGGCDGCISLALLPTGGFVVAGNTGQQSPAIAHDPNAVPQTNWVVGRLTSTGVLDPSFGQSGLAALPAAGAAGYAVAPLANGDILTRGSGQDPAARNVQYLARLLPSGALDPTFAAGTLATLPGAAGLGLLANADGSVVVGLDGGVARYTAAGTLDPAFGVGGVAQTGSSSSAQILPAPAGGVLLVRQSPAGDGRVQVRRVTASGTVDPALGGSGGLSLELPFGGGGSSFLVSMRPRPLPPLVQDTFRGGLLLQRPNGSYLSVGGVTVSRPTGEGTGFSIFDFAAAALTPGFAPDLSFGGPATPLRATLRVPAQRSATVRGRHGIRVTLGLSAPGLARVAIKAAGRLVAQSVLAVFGAGPKSASVELTSFGDQWLRRHHRVSLRVSVKARDLLTSTTTASATGTLRN